jgi:hypothetical protein
MRALRALFPRRRVWWRDAASVRRAMRIWLSTGSVPVAHMVAELDWTTEFPSKRVSKYPAKYLAKYPPTR